MWHVEESGVREEHFCIKSGVDEYNGNWVVIVKPDSSCRAVAVVFKSLLY